ncbi:hypothetical protein RF11_05670 [Thelohanellus kitauei]|uniref:Reverse transcriptase RNase H-like domain-containing protein n=1 Tax=Thelohanellus kitauei TaxID=669202 RepID=A0A0C2LZS1_THEKT|nr:hypothetical protein RF11_05670 [Thelohanellus kitauei]
MPKTMLSYPKTDAPLSLTTDAGLTSFWQPLAFYSRQLKPHEKYYSAFDRELLPVYLSIRHFRDHLDGRTFNLFTDHKPLTFALSKTKGLWSARQQRHLSAISEFTTCIKHISGKQNDWLTKFEQSNNPVEIHKEKEIVSPPTEHKHPPNTNDNSVGRIRRTMITLALLTAARPCQMISATVKDSTSDLSAIILDAQHLMLLYGAFVSYKKTMKNDGRFLFSDTFIECRSNINGIMIIVHMDNSAQSNTGLIIKW